MRGGRLPRKARGGGGLCLEFHVETEVLIVGGFLCLRLRLCLFFDRGHYIFDRGYYIFDRGYSIFLI